MNAPMRDRPPTPLLPRDLLRRTFLFQALRLQGSPDKAGRRLRSERAIGALLFLSSTAAILSVLFILLYLFLQAAPIFPLAGVGDFITGTSWDPTGNPPQYGTLPLTVGTLLVTLGAMIISIPLSLGCAIFTAEITSTRVRAVLKPAIELLAGIPSVVYGFFGLVVLTEVLRVGLDLSSGLTWLAGSILLAIMALPTITSVSEDAIRAVPLEYREGSLAIGATRWQTMSRVIIPAAFSGISAGVILGMGRALGETMAVLMVTGNAAVIPSPIWNVFSPIRNLTASAVIGRIRSGAVAVVPCGVDGRTPLRYRISRGARNILAKARLPAIAAAGILLLALITLSLGLTAALALAAAAGAFLLLRGRLSRRMTERIAFFFVTAATVIVLLVLGVILWNIIGNGLPAISWEFLTGVPRDLGRSGGIFPAIVGTLYLVGGAIGMALPVGVGAAVYLVEYTREGRFVRLVRTGVDLLNGTPSIVFGLFGFAFLVLYLRFGVSLIAGQVTLALMVLPTIIRTTEEALKCVPQGLREGSLALGATRWQTIRRVVLPPAMPGILTGAILAVGRAAGETAPIMFTAVVFSRRFLPDSLLDPVMALPYHLFILATNVPGARTNQYGTALVLLALVIGIYAIAILLRDRFQRGVSW